jgi:hypothetical protein
VKGARGPQDQRDHKAQLVRKVQPVHKDLRVHPAQLVRKEVPASRDLRAPKALEAKRDHPALRDHRVRKASLRRQALCVTSRGPEMLSRAMMAKYLFRPSARKVLLLFREPPEPNAAQQPVWSASVCESNLRRRTAAPT